MPSGEGKEKGNHPGLNMTAKDLILSRLSESPRPCAVHELHIPGYNENNISTRLSELAREGKVRGVYRRGFRFKEWSLVEKVVAFG